MQSPPAARLPFRRARLALAAITVLVAASWVGYARANWSTTTANSSSTLATTTLSPPTGLTVTPSARTYVLGWTLPAAANQGTAQDVQRADNGAAAATVASVAQATTAYTDATVVGDNQYCYDVVTKFNNWRSAPSTSVCGTVIPPTLAVDAAGPTAGYYVASTGFNTHCTTGTTATAINTAQVVVPAPQAVYQSAIFAPSNNGSPACAWTATGLTPNATYQVRFQFAEFQCTTVGCRDMTIQIQGVTVLSLFDIFQAAGGEFIAITRTFTTTASATGQITVNIFAGKYPGMVNGIEIL